MINVFFFGISLATAAAAQVVNGPSMVPVDNMAGMMAPQPTPADMGMPTSMTDMAMPTPPPNPTDYLQYMPYPSFQGGGYKSMDCGYGWSKQGDGSCKQDSWYTDAGCYATTIIIK